MDSIIPEVEEDLRKHGVILHTYSPRKDETDLELSLIWTVEKFPNSEIVVLGAMGGRPDQHVANLLLLALPQLSRHQVFYIDKSWSVRVIHGGERSYFSGSVGDTLSLIPLGGDAISVSTTGLEYSLTNENLHFGCARGVSNIFIIDTPSVELQSGELWAFHNTVRKNDKINIESEEESVV
jgi:thiamine pyrophosphokinase